MSRPTAWPPIGDKAIRGVNAPLEQAIAGEPVEDTPGVASGYPQDGAQSPDRRVLCASLPGRKGPKSLAQDIVIDSHGVHFQRFVNCAAKSQQAARLTASAIAD